MTIVCWDGETLAADSCVFKGQVKLDNNFNKLWIVEDFLYSCAGALTSYTEMKDKLSAGEELIDFKLSSEDTEVIAFCKDDPKHFYCLDGGYWMKVPIKTKYCFGAAEEYAKGCMDAGLNAIDTVKLCIKNHAGASGKVKSINVMKEFFE